MVRLKSKFPALPLPLFVIFIVMLQACVKHDIKQCQSETVVSYINDIRPIVLTNCAITGCHNGDNGDSRNWTDFQKFSDHAQDVKRRIQLPKSSEDHMPRVGAITTTQIQLIICWVEQGAQNN
jgi:hypothetical protein